MNKVLPSASSPEKTVYQGKLISVMQQEIKTQNTSFIIERARRAPGVRLIIVSSDDKILLTKEYRLELANYDIRLPGGKVFDLLDEYEAFLSSGKDLLQKATQAAKKEAREEVGLEIETIQHIATSHCGATIEWDLYYFLATQYHEIATGQALEHGEHISLEWVTQEEAKNICLNGQMKEDRSVAVLLKYLLK